MYGRNSMKITMVKFDHFFEKLFSNIRFLEDWILRVLLGIAFAIHGYQKLPLPSKGMMEWFGFSPIMASIIPLIELSAGGAIILAGFIRGPSGSLLTRMSGSIIAVYMVFALTIAHKEWFITNKLFTSEQIFLLGIALYFVIKGKPSETS